MRERIERRAARFRDGRRIGFLDPAAVIPRTALTVQQARAGQFDGSEIPHDLQRQSVPGTGPATKPRATVEAGIRSVAFGLLSGADGWMFDGEDALGQVDTMSLDNQRNLTIAFGRQEPFLRIAATVAAEMNTSAKGFFGREIIADWRQQLDFTTRIFRPRPAPRRPARARPRRLRLLRLDRRRRALRGQQPPDAARRGPLRLCCTCRRSRPPRRLRCGTRSSPPWSSTSVCRRER